jgi:thiol-disulfide isomerase/thioredoxin
LLGLLACAHARGPALLTADGKSFELKQMAGKVVLLDFWATWCEPCKATLPATQRIADKLGPRGLTTYVVNVEKQSVEVARFLADLHVGLPVLRDPDGVQAEALGGNNLPFAVLLDRSGAVRFREEGARDGVEERLQAEAEKLLAEAR